MNRIRLIKKDQIGLLVNVMNILENADIVVNSAEVNLNGTHAIITLTVSDPEKGKKMLKSAGYDIEIL
ncbi:Uncharacterised protein [Candidatus Bilamarchaeum dharawalense]|uniref:ACT domain-containing protein n=1 Tax=Candidatus Bilamarchaeum dharawalense TaxID=2885759 RepID=A0A5E4LVE0_9ARCH|nr:Uncharacterised protein [Candidatus Bilamarchaeum dharawalense]